MIIFIVFMLISCNQKGEKMKVIAYGTSEFENYIKNAKVDLNEAWNLQLEYYSKHNKKAIGSPLFFIIDDKYLFTPYFNPKIPEVKIEGVTVDINTAKVGYIKRNIKLKPQSQFGWRKP